MMLIQNYLVPVAGQSLRPRLGHGPGALGLRLGPGADQALVGVLDQVLVQGSGRVGGW